MYNNRHFRQVKQKMCYIILTGSMCNCFNIQANLNLHLITNAYVHIVYCLYMYTCFYVLFYRGPLGRLANLAKSATLLKYCINKTKINKT